jgi:hypothetical protein
MSGRHPKTLYLHVLTLPTTNSEVLGPCVVMGVYLLHERFVDDAPKVVFSKWLYW